LTGDEREARAFGVGPMRDFFCQFTTKNVFCSKKYTKSPSALEECSWGVVMA
jgi:hypothetical protein